MSEGLIVPPSQLDLIARRARAVHQAFGWKGGARRMAYVAGVRAGRLRRATPVLPGYEAIRPHRWTHRFDLETVRRSYEAAGLFDVTGEVVDDASRVLDGQLRFYGGERRDIGWPPRWHSFPGGAPGPASEIHWSAISDDLPEDVKDLWEPSRFGFTIVLARAYLLTGDEQWVEAWWQALEDWMHHNRPNAGVNWRCGQEASLRGIAVCFGLSAFADAACTTDERRKAAGRLLTATRQRVRPTVAYALSQRNNHAISELVFLLSVAQRPDRTLERLLCEVLDDQFAADGSYSQLSLNYERLAVHALLWLVHVQPLLQVRTRTAVIETLGHAARFLARSSDPVANRLPNSGANDGALLLDLDATERWDAGPTLAMLGATSGRRFESACWLPPSPIGLSPSSADGASTAFPTLRGSRSLLFTHTGPARHRPGDGDQQSVEVIVGGEPVVLDPGSYRYSGSGVWRQPFTGAAVHNGPRPDQKMETISVGRFLREAAPAAVFERWTDGEATGEIVSRRTIGSITVTRIVVRVDDAFAVVDHVAGGDAVTTWLLAADARREDDSFTTATARIDLHGAGELRTLDRSADDPASGWWSPRYGERLEATAVECAIPDGSVCTVRITPAGAEPVSASAILDAMRDHPSIAAAFVDRGAFDVVPS